jgi:hypothetical protein
MASDGIARPSSAPPALLPTPCEFFASCVERRAAWRIFQVHGESYIDAAKTNAFDLSAFRPMKPRVLPSDEYLPESAVMPHQAKLPAERIAGRASPANDPTALAADSVFERGEDRAPSRGVLPPLRFGRLALWMASATALGIGVLGTVAYSMWFTHDQRVYAEAMTSARRTLGIEQPALANTQSGGMVEAAPATTVVSPSGYAAQPIETATLAGTTPPPDTMPPSADLAVSTDAEDPAATVTSAAPSVPVAATTPAAQVAQVAQVAQRKVSANASSAAPAHTVHTARRHVVRAKPDTGLFARMGAFFHRVSYQQQRDGTTRQRDEYSRP